jgi:WD40 repeat protein
MWDVHSEKILWQTDNTCELPDAGFSPDGQFFVLWGIGRNGGNRSQGLAEVLDTDTGKCRCDFKIQDKFSGAAAFVASGDKFVSAGEDFLRQAGTGEWINTIQVVSIPTQTFEHTYALPAGHSPVSYLAISNAGDVLAVSDNSGLFIWRTRDLKEIMKRW